MEIGIILYLNNN